MPQLQHPAPSHPHAAGTGPGTGPDNAEDWRTNNFDLIRLLAALQVALTHALPDLGPPAGALRHLLDPALSVVPGVPVFFVISGLLISKSYEFTPSLKDYLRNRCLRIFPGLWVCLLATLALIGVIGIGASTGSTRDWLLWWAAQMSLFQHREAPLLAPWQRLNASLWTIPVELQFYLALPVLYFVLRLWRHAGRALLATLLLVSLAAQWAFTHRLMRSDLWVSPELTLAPYLWMFLVGVFIQRNWPRLRPYLAGNAHWWLLAYAVVCVLAWRLHLSLTAGTVLINPFCLAVLAALAVSCALTLPQLAQRILRGRDLSYGLYIYHMLIIALLVRVGAPGGWTAVCAALLLSLAVALLSWTLVERPFLAHKRRPLHPVGVAAPAGSPGS